MVMEVICRNKHAHASARMHASKPSKQAGGQAGTQAHKQKTTKQATWQTRKQWRTGHQCAHKHLPAYLIIIVFILYV